MITSVGFISLLIGCENNNFAPVASMNISVENIRTESIKNLYHPYGVDVDVLRLDLIHPVISGNKWFKLRYCIQDALNKKKKEIVTFGGAYSNHIIATAAISQENGLRSTGIIRGERPVELSQTLKDAEAMGMELYFLSREDYRLKTLPDPLSNNKSAYFIPEGGYSIRGREGAETILDVSDTTGYSEILAAVGTGTMLAGLINAAKPHQRVTGIPVMKNNNSLTAAVNELLPDERKYSFSFRDEFHFGGYAKYNQDLLNFMNYWWTETGIPSDFVYTGKLFYAVDRLIKQGRWDRGSRLLLVHSGGLQGNRSLDPGKLIFSTG
jgi:1-aminocyclopropane-1-carboxylate deaminase